VRSVDRGGGSADSPGTNRVSTLAADVLPAEPDPDPD
jgi:hypothetical protein